MTFFLLLIEKIHTIWMSVIYHLYIGVAHMRMMTLLTEIKACQWNAVTTVIADSESWLFALELHGRREH